MILQQVSGLCSCSPQRESLPQALLHCWLQELASGALKKAAEFGRLKGLGYQMKAQLGVGDAAAAIQKQEALLLSFSSPP